MMLQVFWNFYILDIPFIAFWPNISNNIIEDKQDIKIVKKFVKKIKLDSRKCKVKQFIYISTIHVYGENLSGIVDENTKLNPVGNYAITKVMAEILSFSKNPDVKTIILRLSNAFGAPYNLDANCWSLFFNDLCKQLIQNKNIKSNGTQKRNFISINEVCKAIRDLTSYFKRQKNEIFNLKQFQLSIVC